MSEPAITLADLTTLRVGGPVGRYQRVETEAALIDAVRRADDERSPLLILGGGSNVLAGDAGFPGTVVHVATRGIAADVDACSGATVRVAAGEVWDDFVAHAADQGWVGVEALSGIPGLVGATPIQNVGAYGQEVSQTIAAVRCWDRTEGRQRTFAAADCGFSYRTSRFKADPGRYVVLEVAFQLRLGDLGAPVAYAELARALGVELGERAPLVDVRAGVLALRAGKGMVLDETDHDTWSAGSFFTNPVLAREGVPDGAPVWEQPDGRVKTSAAWLIEHAGFAKGYGSGRARLSTKHTLALTNRGEASAADVLALALEIRDGVMLAFGIELVPEPVLAGCRL